MALNPFFQQGSSRTKTNTTTNQRTVENVWC